MQRSIKLPFALLFKQFVFGRVSVESLWMILKALYCSSRLAAKEPGLVITLLLGGAVFFKRKNLLAQFKKKKEICHILPLQLIQSLRP